MDAKEKQKMIDEYSHFNPTPMSIKQFVEFGRSLTVSGKELCARSSFEFLRRELLVRLANIMKEIHLLPESLLSQSSTKIVQHWYEQSFFEVLNYEHADPHDPEIIKKFTADLTTIRNRHAGVVETMAQGVVELKNSAEGLVDSATRSSIQYFLDRFYMMRISIRMLINQHTILFGGEKPFSAQHVGTIDPECDLQAVVDDAYVNARSLCETYYTRAPELQIHCINTVDKERNSSAKIVYVPSHLYHITFELFKNSMRALCERTEEMATLAPIQVVIVKSAEDVAIKMSDLGGGIPQKYMPRLFEYMFSTAPAPVGNEGMNVVPMAGYGYGLPLSRLYARYFHGDLQVYSMHGYGTDAIIYLKTLSESASELLPVFNKSVLRQYKTSRTHGWSSNQSKFQVEWG
ncbi:pyruvate dehydrogenase (acetyl-transferring) kinase, mitochondrial-like [Paramacrobiotus metropolitanus]|uniref:pyruvate dehydrogenase (acetyl-transferring) kinase, mitochondrial-like n=1 Tax=Paramacrobiotus metropolitanus TaxID=2943436 RepID=UPI0024457EFC|nr:pyruvate dehydrogenase (acetyl-transferring) kinase, mitochondrial-like [Paramacrobiotus metropolitanus]